MSKVKNTAFPALCRVFFIGDSLCSYLRGGGLLDQQKIGSFLKELRKEKGLTQEQFAEIVNVLGRTVSRWETGVSQTKGY